MLGLKRILYFSLLSIFWACAQVVAPSGGERDTLPPEPISINPENASLNYSSKSFKLEFNEFIKLMNLKEELIVSPPLKYDPETRIRGKSLEVRIKDTLRPNTTYVFNFGNAIVDITEGNPLSNFQYVFSTGEEIDSLQLSGKIVDAFQLTPMEGMMVMLYANTADDSLPLKELPNYLSRSNKEGSFTITNIKKGSYRLFALKDANRNFLFDRPDEEIAFYSTILKISKNQKGINLYSFTEDQQKQFIEKQSQTDNQLILDFKKPLDSLYFKEINTSLEELLLDFYVSNDTAVFWWKELNERKTKMAVFDDTLFADTIQFKIDSLSREKTLKWEKVLSGKQNFYETINIRFTRPIKSYDSSFFSIRTADSSFLNYRLTRDSLSKQLFRLSFDFQEDSTYYLDILPGAFTDVYEQTNDTLSAFFSFNTSQDFGTLFLKINYKDSLPKIVQLISNGKVIREKRSTDNSVTFQYLKGGTYGLKLILDRNGNGKWDTGNYLKKQAAERVVIYNEPIVIRSNWDKEIDWVLQLKDE
jgi:hypothetical protein